MTPTTIIAAFCKTGIAPFDRDVFSEADFLSSYVTDRPFEVFVEQESLLMENNLSDSISDNADAIILNDSDNDEVTREELLSSLKPNELEDLDRYPNADGYVLVLLQTSSRKKYYVGVVAKEKDSEEEYVVSFFRRSTKKNHSFLMPPAEDISAA